MRVTSTESLLTLDHVSRKWREMGCTVKARLGGGGICSDLGEVQFTKRLDFKEKKIEYLHEE